jgi:hypothetical protein
MTPRGTAGLALVLIVLCGAYYLSQQFESTQVRRVEEAKRLFAFEGTDVAELGIRQVGMPLVRAAQSAEGRWDLLEPNTTIQPLQPLWTRVAGALASLPNERDLGEVVSPAEYGLEEPALEVRATLRDGTVLALDFGFEEPTRTYRYARLNGGPVFLVKGTQYFELNRSLSDLRHRFLVNDREAPILRFEFARIYTGGDMDNPPPIGTESVVIVAERPDEQTAWRLVEPIAAAADQEVLGALVDELQYAVTEAHVDHPESLADYGLDPPQIRISLTDAHGGPAQTVQIGNIDASSGEGRMFAKRAGEDAVFLLDTHMVSLFPRSPHGLRERRLFTQPVTGLAEIELNVRGAQTRLRRDAEGTWRLTDPDEDADALVTSNLIGGLKDLFALGFPEEDAASLGLDHPDFTVHLRFAEGDPVRLRFRPSPRDVNFYYGEQADGTPILIETERIERLMLQRADFRSRELLRFDARQAILVALDFEGTSYRFERVHDRWVVRQPEGKMLSNQTDVDVLLRAFTPLVGQGEDDTAPQPPEVTGLGSPLCRFEATLRDAAGTEQQVGPVLLGGPVEADPLRRHAAVHGRAGTFRVKQEIVELIREALRGVVDAPAASQETPAEPSAE